MSLHLVLSAFGIFALDEKNEVIAKRVFYPDAKAAVSNLLEIGEGKTNSTIESIVADIGKIGSETIFVEDQMLARSIPDITGTSVKIADSEVIKWFRQNLGDYLTRLGIVQSQDEISGFRYNVGIQLSKAKLSAATSEKDLLVKNAIDAIDELDKGVNVLVMRLREWYSIHHPSLSDLVQDQEEFTRILNTCCGKENIGRDCLVKAEIPEATAESIVNALIGDIGAEMKEIDLTIIQGLAGAIDNLYGTRKDLETYVTSVMEIIAPNMSALVGPLIGARLISLAGSLKELARKPSSTIQVYGAEKALFRSIKTGADPPKHGIIYRVSEVHSSAYWQRGKIARALAGKLSIAARIDAYSDRNVGESLREDFLERVEEIRRQNPEAPPAKPPKPVEKDRKPQWKKRDRKEKGRQGGRR
ncbi:MAG: C/D box methylation guide ribonucleoprotein complex aNOP56 subunit [Candidatus Thorarchaeota archaeon]|nr:C/D box methylation guide ribonucleoprotein complex aNOP56 subunit [Candidatus Thorarchaeota archaeon]